MHGCCSVIIKRYELLMKEDRKESLDVIERRRKEEGVASFGGIDEWWYVCVWCMKSTFML